VVGVEALGPRLVRVTVAGPGIDELVPPEPAASVRLLLPSPGAPGLVIPTWNGNEFLLPDERRPAIRTLTPQPSGPDALALDVVLHDGGVASAWAAAAGPGAEAALSGPGRGYTIDTGAPDHLVAGDETALPAIGQLLGALPPDRPVTVHVEVTHPDARIPLPDHTGATVHWWDLPPGAPHGDTLAAAISATALDPATRVWAAGEAAGVQRIRRHLADIGHPRAHATVRGYWKAGRAEGA
jgi:NADPH-dependent ferric siderophore reductase